jgi:hypothetical protein
VPLHLHVLPLLLLLLLCLHQLAYHLQHQQLHLQQSCSLMLL